MLHSHPSDHSEFEPLDANGPRKARERLRQDMDVPQGQQHTHAMEEAAIDASMDSPEEREAVKKDLLAQLKAAENAQSRVEVFAHFTDTWGADALIGLLMEGVGDAGVSAASMAYLLAESQQAGVSYTGQAKMAMYHLIDFSIGSIPVFGDLFDWFHGANLKSAKQFEIRKAELVQEALEAGVPRAEIDKIVGKNSPALKLVKTVGDKVMGEQLGLAKKKAA